jgi:hypothetical protein
MGSSSSTSSKTQQIDRRIVNESGVANSGDSNTVTINALDGGIVRAALDTVNISNSLTGESIDRVLDFADSGYGQLLKVADNLFQRGERLIGQTNSAVADAYSQAQTDAKSTIDNRTIVVLGVAAAGVAAAFALRKK